MTEENVTLEESLLELIKDVKKLREENQSTISKDVNDEFEKLIDMFLFIEKNIKEIITIKNCKLDVQELIKLPRFEEVIAPDYFIEFDKFVLCYKILFNFKLNYEKDDGIKNDLDELLDNVYSFSKSKFESEISNKSKWIRILNANHYLCFTHDFYKDLRVNVEGVNQYIDEKKQELNFIGLVGAFEAMKAIKQKEKFWVFLGLIGCGVLMLAPIITELSYLWQNKDNLVNVEKLVLYAAVPSITLEVILVYFFRIVLSQHRSIKAQLLQLELRAALCQFVESYAKFAADSAGKNAPISEKFESLIFSGILANEDQIPSTFDGVEQFAKLIDALKKKG